MIVWMLACTGRPPEGALVVVGMDGLDAEELAAAMPSLPTFRRVSEEGFLTTWRIAIQPIWSPVIWTSLSSGYAEEVHGVTHWAKPDGDLYRSDHVLVKRLWDVASDNGRASSVVGWPITWPATPVKGLMVSGGWAPSAAPNRDVTREGGAWPPELAARARDWIQPRDWLRDEGLAEQVRLIGWPRHPITTDEYFLRAWEANFHGEAHALSLLYLCGADQLAQIVERRAQAKTFAGRSTEGTGVGPAWVRAYYGYLDGALARVIARMDPARDTLVVLSDHGFQLEGEKDSGDRHREPAVLMGWGRLAKRGAHAGEADVYDVAATLYAVAGLPLARDFAGEPIAGLFAAPPAPDAVESYVVDPTGKPRHAAGLRDDGAREQLEALGYLDAKGRPAAAPP
ncbi:MAG: alkaline phosphatase family protein [Myxococcota bacterium]